MNENDFLNKARQIGFYGWGNDDENTIMIKIYQNDIDYLSKHYNDVNNNKYFFAIACAFSQSTDVIKFIFERSTEYLTQTFSLEGYYGCYNYVGSRIQECSYIELACLFNQCVKVIKCLVEDCGLALTRNDSYLPNNCLQYASMHNPNLGVVKYLIEDKNMQPLLINQYGDNCLTLACWKNPNIEIPIYYIEECAFNVNHREYFGKNCFDIFLTRSKFNIDDVITFLSSIKLKDIHARFLTILSKRNYEIILTAMLMNPSKNYKLIIKMIKSMPYKLSHDLNNTMIKMFENHIIFDSEVCNKINIIHPVFNNFVTYANFVNQINHHEYYIALPGITSNPDQKLLISDLNNTDLDPEPDSDPDTDQSIVDYTKNHEPLFECNKLCYYGVRKKAYKSMLIFNDIIDTADFSELFILDTLAPKYVINLYVHLLHGNNIDINIIKPKDIESFVRLIDQYPTIKLSIEKMEQLLVQYFIKNNIVPSDQIKDMCDRYKLKYMYMWIHNYTYPLNEESNV